MVLVACPMKTAYPEMWIQCPVPGYTYPLSAKQLPAVRGLARVKELRALVTRGVATAIGITVIVPLLVRAIHPASKIPV